MPSADDDVDWDDPELEYRFHINALPHLKKLFEQSGVRDTDIQYYIEPTYEPTKVELEVKDEWKRFEEQEAIYQQLIQPAPLSKQLGLQTGGGKSALSLFAAAHWGYLTCCIMKPGYIDKWVGDIKKQMKIEYSEIEQVMGLANLAEMIRNLSLGHIRPKIVLISNSTFRMWITEQQKLKPGELVPGFPCEPWEFMQYCGFGFRIIDEVHEDFHFNFKVDLITHIEQSLSLSATLITKNEYLKKMYSIAYPEAERVKVPEYVKYVRSMAWLYDIAPHIHMKTTARGRTSYSHVEFEKSIMKSTKLMKQYLLMVYEVVRKTYLVERKDGQKCLIYFATIRMCELAQFYFKQMLPHLTICKFNGGDELKTVLESDITIATLKKAGTAIDIPLLTTVILTVAINSIQSNLQSLGRLRNLLKLYGLDRIPTFVYFACLNNRKHMGYHKEKQQMLKQKAKVMTTVQHNVTLGY